MAREAARDGDGPQRVVRTTLGTFESHPAIVAARKGAPAAPAPPSRREGSEAGREQPCRSEASSAARAEALQPFLCCDERLIASLISLIERSISASSSSSGETSVPSTLAWIVEANTASPSAVVWMPDRAVVLDAFPLDRQHRDVVALRRRRCAAPARPARAPSRRAAARVSWSVISLSLDRAPEAVGAEQEPVAGLHQQRADGVDHRLAGAAEAGEEHVAVEAVAHRHDLAHRLLQLGVGVVARAGDQLVAAHQVQARIAAMRPVGGVALHQAGDDGRARRVDQRLLRRVAQQLVVAGDDRLVQEAQRIRQRRLAVALEHRGERLQRELRGDLAFRVAAHAVGEGEQARVARVAIAHAVFVLLAAALAADLVDGEAHADSTAKGEAG